MSKKNELKEAIDAMICIFGLNSWAFLLGGMADFAAHNSKRPIGLIYKIFLHIGLSQLIYIIPLICWARFTRKWGLLKGTIFAAVLTILINGSCAFLFFK
jgi:hypothetical protein